MSMTLDRDRDRKRRAAAIVSFAAFLSLALLASPAARAELKLPSIFGSHMVFQRDQAIRVWGRADAGAEVVAALAGKSAKTKAGEDGKWRVELPALPAGGPHALVVESGSDRVAYEDVLVGEVWLCSGQSNMQFSLRGAYDADLEILTARHPRLRIVSVPQVGSQTPLDDFRGEWSVCSPETVGDFSAVGYLFGSVLQSALDVPVGLIDDSWGGSAAEAWVPREKLAADARYAPLLERWTATERLWSGEKPKPLADYEKRLAQWKVRAGKARAAGKAPPGRPRPPRSPLGGNHRPGNLWCGVLHPVIGFGMRGAIWYQGESNAGRAYQYRELFPLMIESWREAWGIGDFSFYWVQLADFMAEKPQPAESAWAELREAQTLTMARLSKTGQAVIIDVGEGQNIHPRDKLTVARRLARWALARDYGIDVPFHSPQYHSLEKKGGKIVLSFDHVGGGLSSFDTREVRGFAIAGADRKFVWAKARIVAPDRIEVSSNEVKEPAAVRYGWADNPVVNVYSREHLPLTPFRTDDWPGVTAGNR